MSLKEVVGQVVMSCHVCCTPYKGVTAKAGISQMENCGLILFWIEPAFFVLRALLAGEDRRQGSHK